MKTFILPIFFILTILSQAGTSGAKWGDYTQAQIIKHLKGQLDDQTVAVRVKGLVCESCGIGLRKKISKIKEVNTKASKKGVEMDVYKMLLRISLNQGKTMDLKQLNQAIDDAGYEAVYFYSEQGGKVSSTKM